MSNQSTAATGGRRAAVQDACRLLRSMGTLRASEALSRLQDDPHWRDVLQAVQEPKAPLSGLDAQHAAQNTRRRELLASLSKEAVVGAGTTQISAVQTPSDPVVTSFVIDFGDSVVIAKSVVTR